MDITIVLFSPQLLSKMRTRINLFTLRQAEHELVLLHAQKNRFH